MAVEARHLHLFTANREIAMLNSVIEANANNNPFNNNDYSLVLPLLSSTTAATTTEIPLLPAPATNYNSLIGADPKTAVKSESFLTYSTVSRKRLRDSVHFPPIQAATKNCGFFSSLGEDISLQIHQQNLDIDRLIAHHMEKVRAELEEKRKRQARRVMEVIESGMMQRLKAKEEEIEKIKKLNWALEERVKSLCIENQIWRDLAQTNEATANALRTNLEQLLLAQQQIKDNNNNDDDDADTVEPSPAAAVVDDAESCCGSTGEEEDGYNNQNRNDDDGGGCWGRTLAGKGAKDKDVSSSSNGESGRIRRLLCRKCGKEESCVLILPCRHLCLCTVCGSTLHTCPVCNSFKNATVHVNIS